jgi:hypothetical protein
MLTTSSSAHDPKRSLVQSEMASFINYNSFHSSHII